MDKDKPVMQMDLFKDHDYSNDSIEDQTKAALADKFEAATCANCRFKMYGESQCNHPNAPKNNWKANYISNHLVCRCWEPSQDARVVSITPQKGEISDWVRIIEREANTIDWAKYLNERSAKSRGYGYVPDEDENIPWWVK